MTRIVVAGTSSFGLPSFETLRSQSDIDIIGVISQPDRPVGRRQELTASPISAWAETRHLPRLTPENWRDQTGLDQLRQWAPDLMVVAAYGLIVPTTVLSIPVHGCLNIHASLLPAYRGASPISAAILHGDQTTGITFMQMAAGMDTGPIIYQQTCPVRPSDTTPILSDRLSALAAEHIVSVVVGYINGKLNPQPQPSGATVVKKVTREDGQMSWESVERLARMVRAYTPWPGVWTTWRGKILKVIDGLAVTERQSEKPGTIVRHKDGWGIACVDGLFVPNQVQFEGKKPQPAEQIPGSYPGWIGSQLGI